MKQKDLNLKLQAWYWSSNCESVENSNIFIINLLRIENEE
jgi:hypothetical protein